MWFFITAMEAPGAQRDGHAPLAFQRTFHPSTRSIVYYSLVFIMCKQGFTAI